MCAEKELRGRETSNENQTKGQQTRRKMLAGTSIRIRRHSSVFSHAWSFLNPHPQLHIDELLLWRGDIRVSSPLAIASWRCIDDNDYGGKSYATATQHEGEGGFVRIGGSVNFDNKTLAEAKKIKGGFFSIQGRCSPVVDLRDFRGLELTMRAYITQTFTLNLKSSSLFEDDIYQVRCELAASSAWKHIKIPFDKFLLTARGMEREYHRANDSLRVESLGFLFKEEDLPNQQLLQLDIKEIKAFGHQT